MSFEDSLPAICAPGLHRPVIVHRTGGKDAHYFNTCGLCGRQIERGDGAPWMTAEQLNDDAAIAEGFRNLEKENL